MGSFGPLHWIVVAFVILVLFGRGRISDMMGDLGKGISSFKKGIKEGELPREEELRRGPARLEDRTLVEPAETVTREPERDPAR